MENNICVSQKKYQLSIAPMLGITNNHFRSFFRLLSKETLLYTEMINSETILYSKNRILDYFAEQRPLVLQLGGSAPLSLGKACEKAKTFDFEEFNLNCGCPSKKVTDKSFGASLMNDPDKVAQCIYEMNKYLPSSIKCRIGVNKYKEQFLYDFIDKTSKNGHCTKYIIHSRVAIMGIDTMKNRTIPPLMYDIAYQLKEKYPMLTFVLNGGIKTLDEVKEHNDRGMPCMIGRAAYDNPWMFRNADSKIYNKTDNKLSRKEIIYKYADYCDRYIDEYGDKMKNSIYGELIRPLTNIFYGEDNNKQYKERLYQISDEIKTNYNNIRDHLYSVVDYYEKLNYNAMNTI